MGPYFVCVCVLHGVLWLSQNSGLPRPPNVPLLRVFWSLLDGIWGFLKGSWGVLVGAHTWGP